MRRDIELQVGATDVGSWLMDHREDFRPLAILRVDPAVVVDHTGEMVIELTVVLEDPTDPDEGWPAGAVPALRNAVMSKAYVDYDATAYVHTLARSTDQAA
jgi:hypothetical protein